MTKPAYTGQGHSLDRGIEWKVMVPRFRLTPTQKRKRAIPILFHVKNNTERQVNVRIEIVSLSRILRFYAVAIKVLGKNRVREESASLITVKRLKLSSNQAGDCKVTAYYYPHFVPQPRPQISLEYTLSAFDENGKIVTHSDPYQILI